MNQAQHKTKPSLIIHITFQGPFDVSAWGWAVFSTGVHFDAPPSLPSLACIGLQSVMAEKKNAVNSIGCRTLLGSSKPMYSDDKRRTLRLLF